MKYDYHADPLLRLGLDYWRRKRGARRMVRRSDIDPGEIRRLLPHIQFTEVIEGGRQYRYRLVGTKIVEAFGTEFTGRYVGDLISGDRYAFAREFYEMTRIERCPVFTRSKYLTIGRVRLVANRLLLPLSEEDEAVDIIMSVLTFSHSGDAPPIGFGAQIDSEYSYMELVTET